MGFSGLWRDLRRMRALILAARRYQPNVGVVGSIGIWQRAIACESDAPSVRRTGRLLIVKITGAELRRRLRRYIEYVQMRPAAVQITNGVLLELQPIDDPGFRRLGFLVLLGSALLFLFRF